MATTNRDRIGRMFEGLPEALDSFISDTPRPEIGDKDWAFLVAAVDANKGLTGKDYNRDDPQLQLRLLTENVVPTLSCLRRFPEAPERCRPRAARERSCLSR